MEIFLGSHHFLLIMKHTPPPLVFPASAVLSIRKTDVQKVQCIPCFFYLCVGLHHRGMNHLSFSRGSLRAHTIIHIKYSLEVHLFDQSVFN